MKINEYLVKVSTGYIPTAQQFEIDEDVRITIEGSVVKIEDKSNQNGTVDRVYIVKGINLEKKKFRRDNNNYRIKE